MGRLVMMRRWSLSEWAVAVALVGLLVVALYLLRGLLAL